MPALHESVVLCRKCDWYVAEAETMPCAECGKPICPGCALPTSRPQSSVCSLLCGSDFERHLQDQNEAA